MAVNLHPKVEETEIAEYGGWQEPGVEQEAPEAAAQAHSSGPLPLLDEADHVTPDQIQKERPWWMNPTPRMLVAGCAAMGLLYVMFSMFGLWGGSSTQEGTPSATTMDATALDQEVEDRMRGLQEENEDLKRQQMMGEPLPEASPQAQANTTPPTPTPKPATVPPRPKPVAAPPPPRPIARAVPAPPPPRPVARPVAAPPRPVAPKPAPAPKPAATAKAEPEPEPMEQWLAAANMGHYTAPEGSIASDTGYQNAAYVPPTSTGATPDPYTSPYPLAQAPGGLPSPVPVGGTPAPGQAPAAYPPQTPGDYPFASAPTDPERHLDIGSSASAVLESGIAWTLDGPEQNRSALLRLEDGFQNRQGDQVLPPDTYLIAQVSQTSDSGLVFMEVTEIVGTNREKISVPAGALQVLAEDGSPLVAQRKKKGGRNFLTDAAAILAPGIERAMGAVAGSADSLILEDGDRSLIRSSGGSDNPLASGIAGVADGASRVFSDKLETRQDPAVPYFKIDGGETVTLLVNQDLAL